MMLVTAWLLCGAALCVGLEAIGARAGERKRMRRAHIALVVCVSAMGALAITPSAATAAIAVCLVAFVAGEGKRLLGDRAAIALGWAAAAASTCDPFLTSPYVPVAYAVCAVIAQAALCLRANDSAAVEAATKTAFSGAAAVLAMAAGTVLSGVLGGAVGGPLMLVGLMLLVGVPPLHGPRTDIGQGAPPSAHALLGLSLFVLGPPTARALGGVDDVARLVVVVLVTIGIPLLALAQVSMRRLFSLLAVAQVAPVLVAPDEKSALIGVVGIASLSLATAQWPALSRPASTWEDISGDGRLMPWRAGLVVVAAALAAGFPPGAAFFVRLSAADISVDTLTETLLLFGAGLLTLPVVRLALFLFGKSPRAHRVHPAQPEALAALALCVTLLLLLAVFSA